MLTSCCYTCDVQGASVCLKMSFQTPGSCSWTDYRGKPWGLSWLLSDIPGLAVE